MTKPVSVQIRNKSNGAMLLPAARWGSSHLSRLVGLQFRRRLAPGEGLVLVHNRDSAAASSIHMFCVFFPIAAVWVNDQGRVTSAQLAKPWRPFYASPEPARYVIEAAPELLERVKVGDQLEFLPAQGSRE